jgi:hypothetical protein
MTQRNRREFLEDSMFAAAAAVTAPPILLGTDGLQTASPNERLGVAVVGVRGRGGSHIGALAGRKDTEILYLCDADRDIGQKRVNEAAKRQRRKPFFVEDLRQLLDDDRVDVVTIATPNHLHALQAIWSMQAGKDVFVENPASHNVWEGRQNAVLIQARCWRWNICTPATLAWSKSLAACAASEALRSARPFTPLHRPLSIMTCGWGPPHSSR